MMIAPIGTRDPEVSAAIYYAYSMGGFSTRSNYARENAEAVAASAVQGFITTEVPREGYGTVWRPTPRGLEAIFIDGGSPSSLHAYATAERECVLTH
jgi:hypothetical protein